MNLDWDELRFVLAIARSGSLSGAARQLGVNQTTVGRRLTSLEEELGGALFLRSRNGFRLTELGETALSDLEKMETAAMSFAETVGSRLQSPSGLVRIATMPWLFNHLLAPAIPRLAGRYPGIELHAIAGLRERSLSNREAELALRFEMRPHGAEVDYALAEIPYAIYAPAGLDADSLPWIGSAVDSGEYEPEKWLDTVAQDKAANVSFRSNDAGVLYLAARAGAGKGLLPEILAEKDPALVRLSGPAPEITRQLRILVHPDVEPYARIRVVIDWLRNVFSAAQRLTVGNTSSTR